MSDNTDKRTATQKIEDLEKVVTMLYQAVGQIKAVTENLMRQSSDVAMIKDAIKLLNKKTDAVILSATAETGITAAAVSALVVKMNVEDLTAQVTGYIASGHLVVADEVSDNAYLVCEELNTDGSLYNPRVQFRLDSQDAATTEALKGKKVGDTISFGENKFSARILELYSLVEPKAPEVTAAETDEASPSEVLAVAEEGANTVPTPNLYTLPTETPVAEFVPSDPSNMVTANS